MSNDPVSEPCLTAAARLEKAGLMCSGQNHVVVELSRQLLIVCQGNIVLSEYPVSTAAHGPGCEADSFKTPTGIHRIAEKIGADQPAGMIFEGRIPTGKIADILDQSTDSGTDLITSRVLWLQGMEPGINQGEGVDSHARYIYIHGTNEEGRLGQPVSHGCVRLSNANVISLFDQIDTGTLVLIA